MVINVIYYTKVFANGLVIFLMVVFCKICAVLDNETVGNGATVVIAAAKETKRAVSGRGNQAVVYQERLHAFGNRLP